MRLVLNVLIFIGGLCVGCVFFRSHTGLTEISSPRLGGLTPKSGIAKSVPIAADIEPAPHPSPNVARFARLKAISDLNKLLSRKISIPMVSGGRINRDFVVLVGLTEVQVDALNKEIKAAHDQLAGLEAERARFEPQDDGTIKIFVPPFPGDGGKVYDHFVSKVRSVIGEDCYPYCTDISQIDDFEFDSFGLCQTEIYVKPMRDPKDPDTHSSMDYDQGGGEKKTVNTDLDMFKKQYPLVFTKFSGLGYLRK